MKSVLANQMKNRNGKAMIRNLVSALAIKWAQDELVIKVALAIANQDPNIKFDSFTVRTSRKLNLIGTLSSGLC